MNKILWLFLALALPITSFASSVEFTNMGGTLSGSSAGLTLSGSTLIADGSIVGNNLGTVNFTTGALRFGDLKDGATFMAGGTFTITGNGTNGVHNGVIFTGSFTGPVVWKMVRTKKGKHDYELSGTISGTWFTGATVDGATVALTANLRKGFFVRSVTFGSEDTNIATTGVVPEPGSLSLLGTGLVGLAGLVRRKLKT